MNARAIEMPDTWWPRWGKRLFDLAIAIPALLLSTPLLAVLWAAVRLESAGPALFRQQRVGRGRELFTLYKLRSMRHATTGPEVTAGDDPRITLLGRWLRRSRLDELPQLINVIRGEMSLVGPRPEVPSYVACYPPWAMVLFEVRPGLFDLATLHFRDEERSLAGLEDADRAYREKILPPKLRLACRGLERSTLLFDLRLCIALLIGGRPKA